MNGEQCLGCLFKKMFHLGRAYREMEGSRVGPGPHSEVSDTPAQMTPPPRVTTLRVWTNVHRNPHHRKVGAGQDMDPQPFSGLQPKQLSFHLTDLGFQVTCLLKKGWK